MEDIRIVINRSSRLIKSISKRILGNDGENLQENFVFSFEDEFVNGQARLEISTNDAVSYMILTKVDETYQLPVKSVMTQEGKISMQLVITEGVSEDSIPIFKSNVFYLKVNKSINAEMEQPEGYTQWIDIANIKLNQMDNFNINVSKLGDTATIEITNRLGETTSASIKDGQKGDTGSQGIQGEPGYTPIKGVDYFTTEDIESLNIPSKTSDLTNDNEFITKTVNDLINYYLKSEIYTKAEVNTLIGSINQFHYEIVQELPQIGANNIMYLVPKTTSETNNIYDEYVYSNGWEKIGDTQIDLSNYVTTTALNQALANYTTTANLTTLLNAKQNVITNTSKLNASFVDDSLSTNKFVTTSEKTTWNNKSDFSGNYNDLENKPTLFSGDYNDLSNKPSIPTIPTNVSAFVNDAGYLTNYIENDPVFSASASAGITSQDITNWNRKSDFSGSYNDLSDKPNLFSGNYNDLSNKPSIPSTTSDLTNDSGFIDNSTDNLTNYYKKSETYNKTEIDNKVSSVYKYKGTVSTYQDLPNQGLVIGDVYNVESDGSNYAWTGTLWDKLGGDIDLSGYQTKIDNSNKIDANLVDDANSNNKFVTSADKTSWTNKYDKPIAGIPYSDLASSVQNSLDLADSALQSHQDISGKVDKINGKGLSTNDYNDNDKTKLNKISGYYGTCTTAAGTSTKEVTCDNFVLETGVIVYVNFTNANTYNGTSTLNVNSTGAKNITRVGTTTSIRYYWSAGEVVGFVYDGTNYIMIEKGTATTSYYGVIRLSSSAVSTSEALALTPRALNSFAQSMITGYAVYSTSATYNVGDRVRYTYNTYECITAITTAEAWTSSHWKVLDPLQEQIDNIYTYIDNLNANGVDY